jgi:hypothetical protein
MLTTAKQGPFLKVNVSTADSVAAVLGRDSDYTVGESLDWATGPLRRIVRHEHRIEEHVRGEVVAQNWE